MADMGMSSGSLPSVTNSVGFIDSALNDTDSEEDQKEDEGNLNV